MTRVLHCITHQRQSIWLRHFREVNSDRIFT